LMDIHEKKRIGTKQIWFIEWISQHKDKIILSIRPEIHCPEIDSIDEVVLENVVGCYDWDTLDIWSKVEYIL
jgi:hypothetical protein